MPSSEEQPRETHVQHVETLDPTVKTEPFAEAEAAVIGDKLEKRLGPEWVASRQGPGGTKLHYLTGEKAIILANSIFGWRGWSSSIKDVKIDFEDEHNGKVSLGVAIIMRVTLKDGTFHEDIGYGTSDNVKGKGQAFEKARKAAVTDGLKRALRNFGNLMGTCLYDKAYLNQISKMRQMPVKYDPDDFYRHPEFITTKKEEAPPAAPLEQPDATNHVADYDDDDMGAFDLGDFDEVQRPLQGAGGDRSSRTTSLAKPEKGQVPDPRPGASNTTSGMSMMARYKAEQAAAAAAAQVTNVVTPGLGNRTTRSITTNQSNAQPSLNLNAPLLPNGGFGIIKAIDSPGEHALPVSFVSARAVPDLQNGVSVDAVAQDHLFNPHSESPSLAKSWSSRIDHSRSGAIKRDQTLRAEAMQDDKQAGANEGLRAFSRPQPPSDFISPHLDPARMVGMPRGAPTPGRGAGSFKPPGMLKRPLGEVSNGRMNTMANLGPNSGHANAKLPPEQAVQGDAKRARMAA